jgi:polyhydroxyalkanoate synthesis repressor PhaR
MPTMEMTPIKIRRYPNRRFYNPNQRCYVTLGDIEQLVREGQTIEVQDRKSGEDITRQILTQILLERHPDKMELFPASLMHGLLRANDLATDLWRAYMREALLAVEGVTRTESNPVLPAPWLSFLLPGFSSQPPSAMAPEVLASHLAALGQRIERLEGSVTRLPDGDNDDLDQLEDRVRGLEERSRG